MINYKKIDKLCKRIFQSCWALSAITFFDGNTAAAFGIFIFSLVFVFIGYYCDTQEKING